MIGNEMNRAAKVLHHEDRSYRNNCYERILHLTDLTIRVQRRATLRRELLRWRDLIAELYVSPEPDGPRHDAAFRSLLMFMPASSEQLPQPSDYLRLVSQSGKLGRPEASLSSPDSTLRRRGGQSARWIY